MSRPERGWIVDPAKSAWADRARTAFHLYNVSPTNGESVNLAIVVAALQLLTPQIGPKPIVTRDVASEPKRDAAIERFVADWAEDLLDQSEPLYYRYNRVDLNGDGTPEVLLRIEGRWACGTGGCRLFVLTRAGSEYRAVSETSLTWAPIVVSDRRTLGWNDLVLWQRSYGIEQPSHYVVLAFDGSKYPDNPSVSPARRLGERVRGVAYLSDRNAVGIVYKRTP